MSNIHKPSGEQSIVAVFHHQPKYKYRITAKYDNFPQIAGQPMILVVNRKQPFRML